MPSLPLAARKRHIPARWTLRRQDAALARDLARGLRLHDAVARVLAARGCRSPEDGAGFLAPRLASLRDPFELRDMDRAAERTVDAIARREPIGIFGDYDVDGVCSTAVVVLTLRRLGVEPTVILPHRIHDGYGMNAARIEELARGGVRLLITVDTGITAVEEVRLARARGMDVIVTDHHLADAELPEAVAIVNPNRPDVEYDGGRLCGVGVAFKFAHALLKQAGADAEEARELLRDLLDLVALGTIADVVPLTGENRVLVHFGLRSLATSRRPGIQALLAESGLTGKPLRPDHVAFILAPRLNAAGRTEDARTALELLLTPDETRAAELARTLGALNQRRRDHEAAILRDCMLQADRQLDTGEDSLLVVAGEDYHLGVVGIVAARLAETFHRPAIVLRLEADLAKGSARSIPRFDIHEALGACCDHLVGYGGHAAAAGLQLSPASLGAFRTAINDFAAEVFRTRDLSPEVEVDTVVDGHEIDWPFWDDLQRLQPFGQDNPAPVFLLEGATAPWAPRIVGTDHLKLSVRAGGVGFSAIGFGLGHLLPICESRALPFDLLFRPMENHFRGNRSLELELVDLRPAAV